MSASEMKGWVRVGDRYEPINTIDGYLARGQILTGACQRDECRRTVRFDFPHMKTLNMGSTDIGMLCATWACNRQDGCRIQWHSTYPMGVPLLSFVKAEGVVEIKCGACGFAKSYSAEQMIARLVASGAGDGTISIKAVGRTVRGKCRCGQHRWVSDFKWISRGPAPGVKIR